MASYNHFSNDNVALVGARNIGVFKDGEKIGRIPLGSLRQPNRWRRLYSFGIVSDPHIGETEATYANLRKALTYFANDNDVEFSVNCGDLVNYVKIDTPKDTKKTELWFISYRDIVAECSGGKPIFAISGNHEERKHEGFASYMGDYAGNQALWYTKEFVNDAFLFLGVHEYLSYDGGVYQRYNKEDIIAIHDFLNANRNKRCFVFQHTQIEGADYEENIFGDYSVGVLPMSVFRHYKNITVFHGHTHSPFSEHLKDKGANFNRNNGVRSVHVPSLGDHCEGYVVDVYEDGIHLRGLNFDTGFIPVSSYWVDTSLVDVSEVYRYKGE